MILPTGTLLGPYEITGALGTGGMGEVYRARDTKLLREVALKILPVPFASDPDRLARFQREAQLLASLNHPNIAAIYGVEEGPASGQAETGHHVRDRMVRALVLELVEGPTLADRIVRGRIPLGEALPIARQIADALEAAHEHGVIHRDLKPSNIKVRPDGTVKVLDFGLAKARETGRGAGDPSQSPTITSPAMTGLGVVLGTPAYMCPEQARGLQTDSRSDIWAFGCVLYEMLSGRHPFGVKGVSETIGAVLHADPDWSALPSQLPQPIRTLLRRCLEKDPKRRLRDIGDARLELDDAQRPGGQEKARPNGSRRERVAWMAAALAVAAVVVTVVWSRRIGETAYIPPEMRVDISTPPTIDPLSFALSPDGLQLVFVATFEGQSRLWVRPLADTSARPLEGTEGASYPFWSPDARNIGFFAGGKLKRIDVSGGAGQIVADAPSPRGGTWNRDDVIVFAPEAQRTGLMRVSAGGGKAEVVTRLTAGQQDHRWPQFLPDERRFVFFVGLGDQSVRGVYVGSLEGEEPKRVLAAESAAAYAPPGYLLYVTQRVLVARRFDVSRLAVDDESFSIAQPVGTDGGVFRSAFSVSNTGLLVHRAGALTQRQLVWMDRAGRTVGVAWPPDEMVLANPEITRDGRRIAMNRTIERDFDVWLMETARSVPTRFTFHPASDKDAVWSPDGDRIVFMSGRNGRFDLFEKSADRTSDERLLLPTDQDKTPLSWSSDGRFLLYITAHPTTGSDLWALPLDAAQATPLPVATSSFEELQGQFSPDGRWVAYVSNESGQYEIYVKSFEGSGDIRVSAAGGLQPRWSRDGRELFYVAPDGKVMATRVQSASKARTPSLGAPVELFRTRLATGGGIDVGGLSRAQYAVAPDGRFLMNVSAEQLTPSPISVILNWDAMLRK